MIKQSKKNKTKLFEARLEVKDGDIRSFDQLWSPYGEKKTNLNKIEKQFDAWLSDNPTVRPIKITRSGRVVRVYFDRKVWNDKDLRAQFVSDLQSGLKDIDFAKNEIDTKYEHIFKNTDSARYTAFLNLLANNAKNKLDKKLPYVFNELGVDSRLYQVLSMFGTERTLDAEDVFNDYYVKNNVINPRTNEPVTFLAASMMVKVLYDAELVNSTGVGYKISELGKQFLEDVKKGN